MRKTLATYAVVAVALAGCGTTDPSEPRNWKDEQSYASLCTGQPDIDPQLSAITDRVTIPYQGHVAAATIRENADNPALKDVSFRVCTPLGGDELKDLAEQFAVASNEEGIGESVMQMGVHALPDDTSPGTIVRDHDFQAHLHNGIGVEGALRMAWTDEN